MTTATSWPLLGLDLLGVFVFALSGGLVAVRKQLDVLSVLVLAAAAGLGGGILRDVLIGAVPPVTTARLPLRSNRAGKGVVTGSPGWVRARGWPSVPDDVRRRAAASRA